MVLQMVFECSPLLGYEALIIKLCDISHIRHTTVFVYLFLYSSICGHVCLSVGLGSVEFMWGNIPKNLVITVCVKLLQEKGLDIQLDAISLLYPGHSGQLTWTHLFILLWHVSLIIIWCNHLFWAWPKEETVCSA